MHARAVSGDIQPGKIDEMSAFFQENLMKAATYFTGPPTLGAYEVRVQANG